MADKALQDEVVSAIKEVARQVGSVPSRRQFEAHPAGMSERQVVNAFGLWSQALKAAGLNQKSKKEKSKIELISSPEQVKLTIERLASRKIVSLNSYKKILCIPDAHYPYVSHDAVSMIYAIIEKEKPDIVVQMGDLYDCYAQSKFPNSLNIYTPKAEWDLARHMAAGMWSKIRELVPNAECFQLLGNHDSRAAKRIEEKVPSVSHLIDEVLVKAYAFDGVTTISSPTEELFISDIAFLHGHYTGIGKHRDFMKMNVVHGHTHKGGVLFKPVWNERMEMKTIWELDCGLIGDPFSKALSYRAQRIHDWTIGCGLIDHLGPRFVAF